MNAKSIFNHYWKFIRKRIVSQVLLLACYGTATIATTVIIPLIYKGMVDAIAVRSPETYEKLTTLIFVMVATIIVYNILFRAADYVLIKSQSKIIKELQDYALEKLQRHSYTFFSNAFVGGLVAKTRRFVTAFETLHDQFIFHIWMNGIALSSSLLVLWRQSWILGAAFFVWLAFYTLLVRFMVKWQIPKSLDSAQADTKTTSKYADICSNILTIKMFGRGKKEEDEFAEETDNQEKKRTAAWMQQNFWNGMFQGVTIGIFNIVIIWITVNLWIQGVVSAGTIVLVQMYVLTSFNIVWNISKNIIRASAALTDAAEMVKIFDEIPEIQDPKNPEHLKISRGKIEFKNVSFSYQNSNKVFEGLNLVIKPGEKVALVGHSGAGKTTITKLLLRFIDIEKGRIEIDGQDITRIKQDDLRNNIAYVPQDTSLFHRSLWENIGYGSPSATLSDIIKAAKQAHAHEFIEKLPQGYDSLVGERGIKLSGGERQRITIARAMLKKSPIVILDEATSSLDSLAEKKIQEALEKLIENKTTIVIAHRLSTIRKMDRIVVFEEGKIAETGTHEKLLEKKGIYSKLWESQVGGFITAG